MRGHYFVFSAFKINNFLGRSVLVYNRELRPSMKELVIELTGGIKKAWPKSG